MILNWKEWTIADTRIRLLKARADYYRRKSCNPRDANNARLEIERIEHRIAELTQSKITYRLLLDQSACVEMPKSLSQIPDHLIERRLRAGLTQGELASRLGINRRTIERYEQTAYCQAKLGTILQIDCALRTVEAEAEQEESKKQSLMK